ncbi:YceI family protein [Mycobacterium antarcticum]|uniref:YceI family protein n=1 Tax=Mycolicibacterium sp. TUM20983 TaxID=3023369 RepID=UPI0032EA6B24
MATHLRCYARPEAVAASPSGESTPRSDLAQPLPTAGRYVIGRGVAVVRLNMSHLFGLGTVSATVDLAGGAIEVADPIAASRVEVRMDATSFDSGNRRRDKHVRGRGLLDTDRWPTITFTADRLDGTEDGVWSAAGTLDVHGQSHRVVVQITLGAVDTDGFTVNARAVLDRRDLGVTGKPGMIGNEISLEVRARADLDRVRVDRESADGVELAAR